MPMFSFVLSVTNLCAAEEWNVFGEGYEFFLQSKLSAKTRVLSSIATR